MALAGNFDIGIDASVGRQSARFRGLDDSGHSLQALQQRPIKTRDLLRRLISIPRKRQTRHKNVVRLQTKVHFTKRHKATHQQARADQQRQRQSHFQHNHGIAQPSVTETAANSFPAIAQRIVQIAPRRLKRRN